jgi:hypothetical protein
VLDEKRKCLENLSSLQNKRLKKLMLSAFQKANTLAFQNVNAFNSKRLMIPQN